MDELASEGWAQMQDLLTKHGLEEKKNPKTIAFWAFRIGGLAACILLAIATYTFFYHPGTDHKNIAHVENTSVVAPLLKKETAENKEEIKTSEKNTTSNTVTSKNSSPKITHANKATKINIQSIHQSPNTIYLPVVGQNEKIDKIVRTSYVGKVKADEEDIKGKFKYPLKIDSLKEFDIPVLELNTQKKTTKLPVEFYAGAGFNISGKSKNQPAFSTSGISIHPSARIILPLNEKFSIQTGLYAFSSINAKEASAKEKELVNNLNANLYYKINTTNIVKAGYFDIPVTLNYHLSKSWTAGAGLEISRMYKSDVKEVEESYDYNENITATLIERYVSAASTFGSPALKNKITIKKWEPRFVLETTLKKGPFLFSAGYHFGPSPSITMKELNGGTNHFKNEYIKIGVQYKIR